jgi:hypothetical protein
VTRPLFALFALFALVLAAVPAPAAIITEYTAGAAQVLGEFPGQSFTTPAGGPWNQITFNFFSDIPATNPSAAGTLYLFTAPYAGSPNGLNALLPDLVATAGSGGGVYTFDAAVTLQPNSTYYAYSDSRVMFSISGVSGYPGGSTYISGGADSSFDSFTSDTNFRVNGVVGRDTAVPEPTSVAVFGLLVLAAVAWPCGRRRDGCH